MIRSKRCHLVACLLDTPDLSHRREQLAAVAKGQREILEVLVCQVTLRIEIDVIGGQQRLTLPQAELVEH